MCFTKYYRNFILCGEADHHCIICNETFHKSEDIEKHIRWERHRKVIKAKSVLPKFKNDGIFKIEHYYYCQFCNHIAHNMALIKEHIEAETHIANKANLEGISKRIETSYDSGVVTIQKINIDQQQWHGIQNKTCLICNVPAPNILKHMESQDHIIRLIQTETKYEGDNKCYRKVNETTFQCFTCMKMFSLDHFDTHWEQHDKTPTESETVNGDTKKPIKIYDLSQYTKLGDREFDIAKLVNIEDEFYNIDIKNKELTCKQCKLAVRNSENDLSNHMYKKHNNYKASKSNIIKFMQEDIKKDYIYIHEKDAGKRRHELAIYGKENHIKLNAGGSKGYCMLCDRFLSAHMNIFTQHVGGCVHTGHLEMKGLMKAKKHKKGSTRTEMFSRYMVKIDYISDFDAVAVNARFCIDRDSFLLIKRIKHGQHFRISKCFVCNETFKWWMEKEHCEKQTHRSHVMSAKVVIENRNFIREIKPKLYHCGLCNITLPYWETLERHITEMSHKMKTIAKDYTSALTRYYEEHGKLPEPKKIPLNTNTDVLYTNIMKVLFETRLDGFKVYTINLEKLQESKTNLIILA